VLTITEDSHRARSRLKVQLSITGEVSSLSTQPVIHVVHRRDFLVAAGAVGLLTAQPRIGGIAVAKEAHVTEWDRE
jgi:hypothetical protein